MQIYGMKNVDIKVQYTDFFIGGNNPFLKNLIFILDENFYPGMKMTENFILE